jgi:hypothetical protein
VGITQVSGSDYYPFPSLSSPSARAHLFVQIILLKNKMGFTIPPRDVPVAVTSLLFTTIAFVLVAARLYTRAFMLQSAGADDYIMTAAMVREIMHRISHGITGTLL